MKDLPLGGSTTCRRESLERIYGIKDTFGIQLSLIYIGGLIKVRLEFSLICNCCKPCMGYGKTGNIPYL